MFLCIYIIQHCIHVALRKLRVMPFRQIAKEASSNLQIKNLNFCLSFFVKVLALLNDEGHR